MDITRDESEPSNKLVPVHVPVNPHNRMVLPHREVRVRLFGVLALDTSNHLVESVAQLQTLDIVAFPSLYFDGGDGLRLC